MKHCFAIGIGGTGSKCIESLVHAAAGGVGPGGRLTVALVDQDRANGNVVRARKALELYGQLRQALRRDGAAGPRLFGTPIHIPGQPVWSPLPREHVTLESHFRYDALRPEAKLLFDSLFEGLLERRQILDEGFRGRAVVGAAAMFSAAVKESGFWGDLLKALPDSDAAEPVRICLFASIFGGTGAAGLPTVARIVRHEAEQRRVPVGIAGVLLLPYFSFPDDGSESDPSRPRAADFLHKTRQALLYYHDVVNRTDPDLFDRLYLIGTEMPFALPNLGPGGGRQENPPLLPEYLAALGAMRFFQEPLPRHGGPERDRTAVMRAGHAARTITWDDMPKVVDTEEPGHDAKACMARLVRFAVAYLGVYRPCLQRRVDPRIAGQRWFQSLLVDTGVDLRSDGVQSALAALDRYCEAVLAWASNISRERGSDGFTVRLFDLDAVVEMPAGGSGAAAAGVRVRPVAEAEKEGFRKIVPEVEAPGLEHVFETLSAAGREREGRGLGVFADRLFAACSL